MKVKRIIFTPVIEDGEHACRKLLKNEFYENPYIYTRTEEEIEVKVPKYQWAVKRIDIEGWCTTPYYENEEEMLKKMGDSVIAYHRLNFTRIEE